VQLSRIIGAAMLVIGVFLLVGAYRASNAPLDQITESMTGHYTDLTMWYFVLGIGGATIGALLLIGKRRR
jgi:uncharacterized membrane protein